MVNGNTRTVDWSTGQPNAPTAGYIACAHIQVIYGNVNLTTPTVNALRPRTPKPPLRPCAQGGKSAETLRPQRTVELGRVELQRADQHGLGAVLGPGTTCLRASTFGMSLIAMYGYVGFEFRKSWWYCSAGKNPVLGSTFVTIGAGKDCLRL